MGINSVHHAQISEICVQGVSIPHKSKKSVCKLVLSRTNCRKLRASWFYRPQISEKWVQGVSIAHKS